MTKTANIIQTVACTHCLYTTVAGEDNTWDERYSLTMEMITEDRTVTCESCGATLVGGRGAALLTFH